MMQGKALRRFHEAIGNAPPDAHLTVGLGWDRQQRWRVMVSVHTTVMMIAPDIARKLAAIYDKTAQSDEWRGKTTGLEWLPPDLRKLADEADANNAAGKVPDGGARIYPTEGRA